MSHEMIACRAEGVGSFSVNQAIYILSRVLDSEAYSKALCFKGSTDILQNFKDVSCAVTGSKHKIFGLKIGFRALVFNNTSDNPPILQLYLNKLR